MKGARTAWASVLMVVGLSGGAAALSVATGPSVASTASLVLRYAPTIHLTNADAGRSYTASVGETIVVVLTPPPAWMADLALGFDARDFSGQGPTPLELRYDSISAQGDLVIAYLAVEAGRDDVGATYPTGTIPPAQCISKVWFASVTVSSGPSTTSTTPRSTTTTTRPNPLLRLCTASSSCPECGRTSPFTTAAKRSGSR